MVKRLLAVAVLMLTAGACAPVMQQATTAVCADVATGSSFDCTLATGRAEMEQQQQQEKQSPPPGPGKKDFTVWAILLTMGFGALYLMAFK
jgi:hypothetical protein